MASPSEDNTQDSDLVRGLPMISRWEPEAIAAERAELQELAGKPFGQRCRGYFSRVGPGWLQSAMTLGGGSAAASLFAGAYLQYDMLWVQPLAMLLGVIMLSGVAYQTLATGVRPFDALRRYVHPTLAWTWAIASLVATIIWHFPQYALAGGMAQDVVKAISGNKLIVPTWVIGIAVLLLSIYITWNYGRSGRGIRAYERTLKYMVWMIVIAFALVVVRRIGSISWVKVISGFLPLHIPNDPRGVSVFMAAFGAAVGINMTFLFPYTLLARGWGTEHQGLAKFDLITGMLIPYVIATSLMIIATGSTIFGTQYVPKGTSMSPIQAAQVLSLEVGPFLGRIIFGLGIIGMALSTITLHMLVSAFIVCEIFKWEPTGWHYRIASLIPVPGIFGTILWGKLKIWIAVPTSAICGLLLPIAYIGFFILHNRRDYLGDSKPRGVRAVLWNIGMLAAIIAASASGLYYLYVKFV